MTDHTAFEAHFALTQRQQQRHRDGSYRDPITQARWEGWQAAKAERRPVAWMVEVPSIVEGWFSRYAVFDEKTMQDEARPGTVITPLLSKQSSDVRSPAKLKCPLLPL